MNISEKRDGFLPTRATESVSANLWNCRLARRLRLSARHQPCERILTILGYHRLPLGHVRFHASRTAKVANWIKWFSSSNKVSSSFLPSIDISASVENVLNIRSRNFFLTVLKSKNEDARGLKSANRLIYTNHLNESIPWNESDFTIMQYEIMQRFVTFRTDE